MSQLEVLLYWRLFWLLLLQRLFASWWKHLPHSIRVGLAHAFIETWRQRALAFCSQFLLKPFRDASLLFVQVYLIAVLLQVHVILPRLDEPVAPEIYVRFCRYLWIHLREGPIRMVQGFATNLREEGPSALLLGLVDETGIQEIVMVYLNTSLSLSILEMIIEFPPYLFLSLVEV